MTQSEIDLVYAGKLDFVNGEWVAQASKHSPGYYRIEEDVP